jgi:uncharacterized protein involved in type VI secretion and phage assembly
MSESGAFLGKFRGLVTNNKDPQNRGRLRVKVPDVLGDNETGWALPSLPYAADQVGLYTIPPVDASVWVEFEHGDPDYPIWSGCFWEEKKWPSALADPKNKVLKTEMCTITLANQAGSNGEITIETKSGAKITLNENGIEIADGKGGSVTLKSAQLSVNQGALEVI